MMALLREQLLDASPPMRGRVAQLEARSFFFIGGAGLTLMRLTARQRGFFSPDVTEVPCSKAEWCWMLNPNCR